MNLELKDKMEQTHGWMGRRSKGFELMIHCFNDEDGHKEAKEKKKQCRDIVVCKGEVRGFGWIDLEPKPKEQISEVVSFLLKDLVAFECLTRCCMTGEEGQTQNQCVKCQ